MIEKVGVIDSIVLLASARERRRNPLAVDVCFRPSNADCEYDVK